MKAWPLLLLLAAAYWIKKELGFNSGEEFSSELNAASQELLDFAVIVFFIALLWFFFSLLRRKKTSNQQSPRTAHLVVTKREAPSSKAEKKQ
jgi:hypothetical protein